MATHDYVIDNQTAPNFRVDLNNALLAIVSQNSNATSPSVTYANMFWYDTANNQLKKRNEANSDWITLGTIDEGTGRFTPTGSSDTGSVTFFATSSAPAGWLKANGAAVSRTTYAALFSAIGTTFGVGDGSTTFNVPDLRGEFIRGWDDGRGIDSGRAFGSAQADELKSHTHTFTYVISNNTLLTNVGSGGTVSPTTKTTNATGGTETRPRNIALLACIKF
jgi:microcystin-dependent protein